MESTEKSVLNMVAVCKISVQTGTLVRCGGGFVINFFEGRHRGLTFRKAEKCLEKECVCLGKCRQLISGNKTWPSPQKYSP